MTILNLLQANGFSTECEADSWSRFGLNQVIAMKKAIVPLEREMILQRSNKYSHG